MKIFKAYQRYYGPPSLSTAFQIEIGRIKKQTETIAWVMDQVAELSRQIEESKDEANNLQASRIKRPAQREKRDSRLKELTLLNERRFWHVNRLSAILEQLKNNSLDVNQVVGLKEHISLFVENNEVRFSWGSCDSYGVHSDLYRMRIFKRTTPYMTI